MLLFINFKPFTADIVIMENSITGILNVTPEIDYHEIESDWHLVHCENPDSINADLIEFVTAQTYFAKP